MPKDGADYKQAIADRTKPEWQEVKGKDFRRHFRQWQGYAARIDDYAINFNAIQAKVDQSKQDIANHLSKIERDRQSINKFDSKSDEGKQNIKLRQEAIAYREAEIAKHQKYLDSIPKAPINQVRDSRMLYIMLSLAMRGMTLIGVKNEDEMGAAAAIVPKKDHIYIGYLMTNPRFLITGKSKGSGTAAIKAVAKRSLDTGKNGVVKLWALNSAVPFYEKLGFTRDDPSRNDMTLSPQAAKKLLGL